MIVFVTGAWFPSWKEVEFVTLKEKSNQLGFVRCGLLVMNKALPRNCATLEEKRVE